jgi:hypothetical protein
MPTHVLRFAIRPLFAAFLLVAAWPGRALAAPNDKADCAAALKGAQADKAAGHFTKAQGELATCARPVCPKPMQKQCTDLAAAVTESQPTVIFSAKDASGKAVTAVTVTVDGAVVTSNLDGTAVPVDPGSHAMKFESDGATPVEKQVSVDPTTKGQAVSVDLDVNPPAAAVVAPVKSEPAGGVNDMWDTTEDPTKRYYFLGLRYRGTVIPQFMLDIFVNGGKTLYSNSLGLELDMRKDNFSLIPAISYTEYGSGGDVVFSQKNQDATLASNWSVVNSSLKGVYASVDLLWSVKIANHWMFEYGAAFGLGAIFGSLENDWVYPKSGTQVSPSNYIECQKTTDAASCSPTMHSNSMVSKVGGYVEPNWFNGGSVPTIFPLINFPELGIRYKPMKQLEARVGGGFSLTGFWFGLSADYGLEQHLK